MQLLCTVEGQLSSCGLGKGSQDAAAVSATIAKHHDWTKHNS